MVNRKRALQLKIGTAVLITLVNISVFCIWIPARLQVNDTYERLNVIWDRIEKVIILLVDAGLNYYFVRIVQKQLVKPGLTKYRPLVRFNLYMILISLAMDCLIIGEYPWGEDMHETSILTSPSSQACFHCRTTSCTSCSTLLPTASNSRSKCQWPS